MKRWMILAAAMILSLSALLPASAGAKEQNLVMACSWDSYDTAYYYYNADGTLAAKLMDSGSVYTYQYRKDGSLEKETQTYTDGDESLVTEYDKKGNPTVRYSLSGKSRYVLEQYRNAYDDKGRPLEIHCLPDDSLMGSITSYTYWENGCWEVEESDYLVYGQEQIPHCCLVTTYNADGQVSSTELTLCDMEAMDTTNAYTYDSHGNLKTQISSWVDEETGHCKEVRTYDNSYNGDGNLKKTKVWLESNTTRKKALEKTITYTYNSQGLLIRKKTHNEQYDFDSYEEWEYDEYGNVTYFQGTEFIDGGIGKGLNEEVERWYAYLPLEKVLFK